MTTSHSNRASASPHTSDLLHRLAARLALIFSLSLAATLAGIQPTPAPVVANSPALAAPAQACTPTIRAVRSVSIRLGPSVRYNPPIGTLFAGNRAQVTGRLRNNSWYRILFNNQEGWIPRASVRASCLGNAPVVPALPLNNAFFRADALVVAPGQCTTLRWNISDVAAVYLISEGAPQGVGGHDSRQVCPANTTTYLLRVQRRDGSVFEHPLTITVAAVTPIPLPNFRADAFTVNPGQCTTLRWSVTEVRAVYLWTGNTRQGVGGNDSRQVCPQTTTTYRLQVLLRDGGATDYFVTVMVSNTPAPGITFTVDNGNITRGQCTSLRWQVTGAFDAVYLIDTTANTTTLVGANAAVGVCPQTSGTYTLRVIGVDGRQFDQSVNVNVSQGPTPAPPPTPQP